MPNANLDTFFSRGVELLVLYDEHCPLCKRSVAFLQSQSGSERLRPLPLQTPGVLAAAGIAEADALARLHVVRLDGGIERGARAVFAALAVLPRWRWVAWGLRVPGVPRVAERVYDHIAANRARTVCDGESCHPR